MGSIGSGRGALSSISLTTERAPPLSNSLHTIYQVLCIIFTYRITLSVDALILLCVILFCRYVLVSVV